VLAQVVEDRGPLGVNRRRLYRIRLDQEQGESFTFEVAEEDLEPARMPDKAALMRYLREGGLVAILRANLDGSRDGPRAWLTFTPRGGVAHTFEADRGLIGGKPVPYFALHEGKVFTGKAKDVVNFLASFGLTRAEAEETIRVVGTAP
jgi:hypothetical protein